MWGIALSISLYANFGAKCTHVWLVIIPFLSIKEKNSPSKALILYITNQIRTHGSLTWALHIPFKEQVPLTITLSYLSSSFVA